MEGPGLHKCRAAVPAGHGECHSSCPDMAQRAVLQNRLLLDQPRQEMHARKSSGCAVPSLGQTACPPRLCQHIADNVEDLPLGGDEGGEHRAHGPNKEDEGGLCQHRRIDKRRRLALQVVVTTPKAARGSTRLTPRRRPVEGAQDEMGLCVNGGGILTAEGAGRLVKWESPGSPSLASPDKRADFDESPEGVDVEPLVSPESQAGGRTSSRGPEPKVRGRTSPPGGRPGRLP